jgi:hypothetical protein
MVIYHYQVTLKIAQMIFFFNSRILTCICVYHVAYAAECVKYMNLEINALYKTINVLQTISFHMQHENDLNEGL